MEELKVGDSVWEVVLGSEKFILRNKIINISEGIYIAESKLGTIHFNQNEIGSVLFISYREAQQELNKLRFQAKYNMGVKK